MTLQNTRATATYALATLTFSTLATLTFPTPCPRCSITSSIHTFIAPSLFAYATLIAAWATITSYIRTREHSHTDHSTHSHIGKAQKLTHFFLALHTLTPYNTDTITTTHAHQSNPTHSETPSTHASPETPPITSTSPTPTTQPTPRLPASTTSANTQISNTPIDFGWGAYIPPTAPPKISSTPAAETDHPLHPNSTQHTPHITVTSGDTLWAIAARHLPPTATDADIARACLTWAQINALHNPNLIYPQQQLTIPEEYLS